MALPLFSPFSFVGGIAIGTGLGNGIRGVIEPTVQDLVNAAWRNHPVYPLTAYDAAQLVVTGERSFEWGQDQAQTVGVNIERFQALCDVFDSAPDQASLFALWRRDRITDADFHEGIKKIGIEDKWIEPLAQLKQRLLSPPELANARQQEFIGDDRLHSEGALQGYTAERMDLLFKMAGLPPGVMDSLQLLRRNIIDENTYRAIVAEGHTKTKYTDSREMRRTRDATRLPRHRDQRRGP